MFLHKKAVDIRSQSDFDIITRPFPLKLDTTAKCRNSDSYLSLCVYTFIYFTCVILLQLFIHHSVYTCIFTHYDRKEIVSQNNLESLLCILAELECTKKYASIGVNIVDIPPPNRGAPLLATPQGPPSMFVPNQPPPMFNQPPPGKQ